MVQRDFSKLNINYKALWQPTTPTDTIFKNVAYDTETVNGKAAIICNSDNEYLYTKDYHDILKYLVRFNHRNKVNFFYNLTYDSNAIIGLLPKSNQQELAHFNFTNIEDFVIKIMPDKLLSVGMQGQDSTRNFCNFFDLAQYYSYKPLDKLGKEFFGEGKIDIEGIDKLTYKKLDNKEYQNEVIRYCLKDCDLTKRLADKFTGDISPLVQTNKYYSTASISRQYFFTNLKTQVKIPHDKLLAMALQTYHAGFIETVKIGKIKNVYNPDINSAYPAEMAKMPNTEGVYLHNKEYEPDASYSYFKVQMRTTEYLPPLFYHLNKSKMFHLNGMQETYINKREYELFDSWGYDIIILDAKHLIPYNEIEYPLKDLVEALYKRRLQYKADKNAREYTYKIILNSFYGLTININENYEIIDKIEDGMDLEELLLTEYQGKVYDKHYTVGKAFNPLFADFITSGCRNSIFTAIRGKEKDLISVNTDGIFSKNKHSSLKLSKALGDYSLEKIPSMLSVGNGRYVSLDKEDEIINKKSKFRCVRGITQERGTPSEKKLSASEYAYQEFLLNYMNPQVTLDQLKVVKLKESLNIEAYHDKMNHFINAPKTISCFTNRREWEGEKFKIGDLFDTVFDSRPFDVAEV